MRFYSFLFFLIVFSCFSNNLQIFDDLEKVYEIDAQILKKNPFIFNALMQGGYLNMPSAKMPDVGIGGASYTHLHPYQLWSVNFQYFSRLEITANYWIYKKILEGNFGNLGYGYDSDRAANFKINLWKKYFDLSFGMNDFMGTKRFFSTYLVATKEFFNQGLEFTLGFSRGRIKNFFGGFAYSPFHNFDNFIKNFSFFGEYDANDYKKHKYEHILGKNYRTKINLGANLTLSDILQLKVSSLRGKKVAAEAALFYNFGNAKGFFPKVDDPPLYRYKPNNLALIDNLKKSFASQKIDLTNVKTCSDKITITLYNNVYRKEKQLRARVESILSTLPLEKFQNIKIVLENNGLASHEYNFKRKVLEKFQKDKIFSDELSIIASKKPFTYSKCEDERILFKSKNNPYVLSLLPHFRNYFGSSTGKFKYDLGINLDLKGFLFNQFFYSCEASYIVSSSSASISDRDFLNPSQLLNVHSDYVRYWQANSFHIDRLYLQKNWNLFKNTFLKLSGGYFEIAYFGGDIEFLYSPIKYPFAIGLDLAVLLKRKYSKMTFFKKIRKFDGDIPTYVNFTGLQYFLDIYYNFTPLDIDFKISIGQFLAKDKGARFEMSKCFPSGFNLGFWYTLTNGNDKVNGKTYFDKGLFFSIPLDIFLKKSSKTNMGYSMSAWLRDVGYRAETGKKLYDIVNGVCL